MEKKPTKEQLTEACKAYGITPEYVSASGLDGDVAVIVTHGGKKVRYRKGDEVEPLSPIEVTGINLEAGKKKKAKK